MSTEVDQDARKFVKALYEATDRKSFAMEDDHWPIIEARLRSGLCGREGLAASQGWSAACV